MPDNDRDLIQYAHCTRRKSFDTSDPSILGVELEIYSEDPYTTARKIHDLDMGVITERDGSLHHLFGIELVFPPTPYVDLVRPESALFKTLRILRKQKCLGWKAGTNYGCHISVNSAPMDVPHMARFVYFVNRSVKLGEKVSGRKNRNFYSYAQYVDLSVAHQLEYKYQAASVRSRQRIEVRIFRSTVADERMLKNIEYVRSVWIYTKSNLSESKLNADDFWSWLEEPVNRVQFPVLHKYLKENMYVSVGS